MDQVYVKKGLKMKNEDGEDKDEIKGLIWVNNHIDNEKEKNEIMRWFKKKVFRMDAIRKRWEAHFATQRQPNSGHPKYSLMGFTWAFKGARPSLRRAPDAVEAQADWWLASKAFFDGHVREPPQYRRL
ncbi:hypothetical protein Tco_0222506 [Tanacetum coccineum]